MLEGGSELTLLSETGGAQHSLWRSTGLTVPVLSALHKPQSIDEGSVLQDSNA